MKILSHRGIWNKKEEKNTESAFINSFLQGFGIETDIRDFNGELVISHDVANRNSLKANEFFKIYSKYDQKPMLALNVKSDGIQNLLVELIKKYNIDNYFIFDMSIPEQYVYTKENLNIFTRQSDIEKEIVLYEKSCGIWLDSFEDEWIDEKTIEYHVRNNKKVCIVSPELHNRNYRERWEVYKKIDDKFKNSEIFLCTDKAIEARSFFNE